MNGYEFITVVLVLLWVNGLPFLVWKVSQHKANVSDFERTAKFERDFFDYMGVHRMFDSVSYKVMRAGAKEPVRHHAEDAGADVFACLDDSLTLRPGEKSLVSTGVAVETPEGWVCDVRPRSGLAHKFHVSIVNAPGTVDAGYTGEIFVNLENRGVESVEFAPGDAIAQLVFLPVARPVFRRVDSFEGVYDRGDAGHGSTSIS